MAWIKRNLFFFIGGLVALGLLGTALFYTFTSYERNSDKRDTLGGIYATLQGLNSPDSSPGNDKINKIEQARDQDADLHAWLSQAKAYFQPIESIPPSSTNDPVTSKTFAAALSHTVSNLKHEAEAANVYLPSEYDFSFKAERELVTFSPGSLDQLAAQLGEVKAISEILYAAGINQYDGIQRVRVAAEDLNGQQSDYVNLLPSTNDFSITIPYTVTFRSFGPEIAQVFSGFAASPHGFVIKTINVQPAGGSGQPDSMPQQDYRRSAQMQAPNGQLPGKGGLVTVLKEQLLRVSVVIEIVKLQAKN